MGRLKETETPGRSQVFLTPSGGGSGAARPWGPPGELAQLLRLRNVRVEAAQAAVRVQRVECEQAAAAVQARQQQIDANRASVDRHAAYTVGEGAADLPRLAAYFSAFRDRLDDMLERSEYGLVDDEEALETSESRLCEKRQDWLREQSRRDGVEEAWLRSRRAWARHAENQADNEADELRRSSPLAAGSTSSLSSRMP